MAGGDGTRKIRTSRKEAPAGAVLARLYLQMPNDIRMSNHHFAQRPYLQETMEPLLPERARLIVAIRALEVMWILHTPGRYPRFQAQATAVAFAKIVGK